MSKINRFPEEAIAGEETRMARAASKVTDIARLGHIEDAFATLVGSDYNQSKSAETEVGNRKELGGAVQPMKEQLDQDHKMPNTNDLNGYLEKATVAPEVFTLRPDYRALLIVMSGITPGPSDEASEKALVEAEAAAQTMLAEQPVTELPHIAAWREAYKSFGAKPNKTRNSLEALTRRVASGLPRVNRLTDIYNAISVKHQIPLGGEDVDKYSGAPRLIRSDGKEDFEVVSGGEKVIEHPVAGEVVWCDETGVTCRIWNWRQGPRTALTDATTSAVFILDALQPCSDDQLTTAADELVGALKQFCPELQVAQRILSAP